MNRSKYLPDVTLALGRVPLFWPIQLLLALKGEYAGLTNDCEIARLAGMVVEVGPHIASTRTARLGNEGMIDEDPRATKGPC